MRNKQEEKIYKEVILDYISLDYLDGPINEVIELFVNCKNTKDFIDIKVSTNYDSSDYDSPEITITGKRLETDKEFEKRKNDNITRVIRKEKAKQIKEEQERKEYFRLRKKYD